MLARFFPFLAWFKGYSVSALRADFISGLTVALVLVPQSMAYAQLADLPAYYGLYAAFLPPLIAAMWGSSYQLATGPVAVVSLMTSTALAPLATAGSEAFIAYAILLALLVGLFQFLLGVFRLGMVVNFLSHPVVNGFTNAAAIIIATSQLSKLFGVTVDKAEHHYETIYHVILAALKHTHWPTLGLAVLAFSTMIILKRINPRIPNVLVAVIITTVISWATGFENNRNTSLDAIETTEVLELVEQYNQTLADVKSKMEERIEAGAMLKEVEKEHGSHSVEAINLNAEVGALEVVLERLKHRASVQRRHLREYRFARVRMPGQDDWVYMLPENVPEGAEFDGRSWKLRVSNRGVNPEDITMAGGGAVVGVIPRGLPEISMPKLNFGIMLDLLPMAIIISLLGFMEAISIAKAMAARTGQRLDPNQELIGQGLGNMIGCLSQSYPVSGSFSRSAVNLQAGAVTGLSNAFSTLVVMLTLLFFTPMLYHLPQSVLASVIMMAVIGLVNVSGFVHAWKAQKYDGIISVITFVTTLYFAPHLDRGIMIGVLLSLALYLLRNMKPNMARLSKSQDGYFRDAGRWKLETCKHVSVLRFNNSLFFANVNYLEDEILEEVSMMPELKHVLIVGNGMNELDASGEVLLSQLVTRLRESGHDVSFSGLNEHVLDVMRRTHLYEKIGEGHFYPSVAAAVREIHKGTCLVDRNYRCPLLAPRYPAFEVAEETEATVRRKREWGIDESEEVKDDE
ncbi:STAS domain-containing protein [bacterium]|nr:STAS domain-containing protein [bacterium]